MKKKTKPKKIVKNNSYNDIEEQILFQDPDLKEFEVRVTWILGISTSLFSFLTIIFIIKYYFII